MMTMCILFLSLLLYSLFYVLIMLYCILVLSLAVVIVSFNFSRLISINFNTQALQKSFRKEKKRQSILLLSRNTCIVIKTY